MIKALYVWLPRIFGCHCRSDRSFFYHGHQFPICARCTGELAGIMASCILFWFWKPTAAVSAVMMLPLVIDGFTQQLTSYESTNIRRLITGILFGIGISSIFARTTIAVFNYGIGIGRQLR